MRPTVNHRPPAITQPEPADNTSEFVAAQLTEFRRNGKLVHTQIAMEIASWYATGDNAIAQFASTGTLAEDLLAEVDREREAAPAERSCALAALRAYVSACKVATWSVGANRAGKSPDRVYVTMDWPDALQTYLEWLGSAPEDLAGKVECTCTDDSLCTYHEIETHVRAYLRQVHLDEGTPQQASVAVIVPGQPLAAIFWLTEGSTHFGDPRVHTG